MTKRTRVLAWVALSFSLCCLLIGYAVVADNLTVTGSASVSAKPFEGVYITDVTPVANRNATNVEVDYLKPTNLSSTVRATASGGSVTYKVTVYNNTGVTYWYNGTDLAAGYGANALIGTNGGITITTKDHLEDSAATFNKEDWIPPRTAREFYVTYAFGASAQGERSTLVNFRFSLRMDSVHDEFLTLLNDTISSNGYHYLAEVFDEKYAEDGTTVIANVGDDLAIFNQLFGHSLSVTVDGVEKPVTVMIRRDNVDKRTTGDSYAAAGGPTGCEYTVYLSVENVNAPGTVTVFAVSYTCDARGNWYQLGELYEGTASVVDYDKSTSDFEGAFNVSTWKASAKSYEMADGIVYKVGQAQGDQYDKLNTLEQLMSTFDQDIFNDIDNSKIFKKAYDILQANKGSDDPAVTRLQFALDNAAPYYNNYNNGQEFKVKRDFTRAELIPYIEAIQQALDYYYQAHG